MLSALGSLTADGWLLFGTRFLRLFAYGALSVVLVLYLVGLGFSEAQTGLLLTAVLLGDTLVSLYLTTRADRAGRRRMLIAGAILMTAAGIAFALTDQLWLLVVAGTIGVISPSGHEVGPFLPIEQAALAQVVPDRGRTDAFAWYTLTGSIATACGALAGGWLADALQTTWAPVESYRAVVVLYACAGAALCVLFSSASASVEAPKRGTAVTAPSVIARFSGLHRSQAVALRLSALFALDSFGGGFVVQSFAAYWFYLRFGVDPKTLGALFFGANVLAGCSALVAARLANRIGLVNTMVLTHLPSNVLLILIPLMPTLPLAMLMLLLRFCISQMDVPARQSYTMAVVTPDERAAASGVTGVARTTGAALSPLFAGLLFAQPSLIDVPFYVAGVLKMAYDLLLFRAFRAVKPPEEAVRAGIIVVSLLAGAGVVSAQPLEPKCRVLCGPAFHVEPTVTFTNLFGSPRIVREDGATVREPRATEFEVVLAVGLPTRASWLEFTVETIFRPFDSESTPELELETNLVWLPAERTGGWVSSHVDVVDKFSPAERPRDTRAYTHKLNFEWDTSVAIFNRLPEGRWLKGVELEGSLDYVATGLPRRGDVVDGVRFLDDASPWSFSIVFVLPVAPL